MGAEKFAPIPFGEAARPAEPVDRDGFPTANAGWPRKSFCAIVASVSPHPPARLSKPISSENC